MNYRNKIYEHYSTNSGTNLAPLTIDGLECRKPFFDKIVDKHFPNNKNIRILEIGSGYGAFGYFLQKVGYINYIGIDASESQVKEAIRLGIKNIILYDLIEYINTLEDNCLDMLIALDVIEHFTKEELTHLINSMYRVVKKDALIITHQPNGESPFSNGIRYGDFTHELSFTASSISQIFLSSGFETVQSFEDKPIAHGLKSGIRLILWNYLVRPIYKILLIIEGGGVDKNIVLTRNFLTIIKK